MSKASDERSVVESVTLGLSQSEEAKVTDAGLKELKELKSLRELTLFMTKVTDAGVKELKAALPKLNIVR